MSHTTPINLSDTYPDSTVPCCVEPYAKTDSADSAAVWIDAMDCFLESVEPEIDSLEERLEDLKETAANELNLLVHQHAELPEKKVVFALEADGSLLLTQPESFCRENAEKMGQEPVKVDPKVEGLIQKLAVESALLRCVEALQEVSLLLRQVRSGQAQPVKVAYPPYQVSLKGSLSHFFIPKK